MGDLFNIEKILLILVSFFSLAFISSCGYTINDLIDYKKDRLHPEKKKRPIASGKISKFKAVFLAIFLLISSFLIAIKVNNLFFLSVLSLFIITTLYTLFLKNIFLVDVLAIASLFVIRAIAGAVAIEVTISHWLILIPFFLSLFLSIGKRHTDVILLKEKASLTREVLKYYNLDFSNSLMVITTTMFIISYTFYSFLSGFKSLIFTLPLALYTIFRFFFLIKCGSIIARNPEKVINDKGIMLAIALWCIVTTIIIYTH